MSRASQPDDWEAGGGWDDEAKLPKPSAEVAFDMVDGRLLSGGGTGDASGSVGGGGAGVDEAKASSASHPDAVGADCMDEPKVPISSFCVCICGTDETADMAKGAGAGVVFAKPFKASHPDEPGACCADGMEDGAAENPPKSFD